MGLHIIVGAQFGSEGKGKVAYYIGKSINAEYAARVGGPNSGHSIVKDGKVIKLKVFPTLSVEDQIKGIIFPAGFYFKLSDFYKEKEELNIKDEKIIIDPNAVIIDEEQINNDIDSKLIASIGSTGSGLGEAVRRRVSRKGDLLLAKDCKELEKYIDDTKYHMRHIIDNGNKDIVVEGTQGFGLSVLHSKYYPYVTSRDTTAAAVVSELGLSPFDVDSIYLVIRAFPIRVGGNSGILENEIEWEEIAKNGRYKNINDIVEYTTVTNRKRRVGKFSGGLVIEAINSNKPTHLVLNHLDLFDHRIREAKKLTEKGYLELLKIESILDRKIDYIGISPNNIIKREDIVILKDSK